MTRTQIQGQLNVIKELPEYTGSIDFVSQQLASWLLASDVDPEDADKILADIESYAY